MEGNQMATAEVMPPSGPFQKQERTGHPSIQLRWYIAPEGLATRLNVKDFFTRHPEQSDGSPKPGRDDYAVWQDGPVFHYHVPKH
jgi:hypothetical protein